MGEIPIIFVDRTRGKSKMNRGIIVEALRMTGKLKLEQLLTRPPVTMVNTQPTPGIARIHRG
jgi:hypothetical protein